ncbi:VirK/YbjX family protein (plasmid) [Photobacterium sp. DA100]|uniref:VirK/YbjX family protein n=1 Tax=Photobacterium sp. DA100 TaxID=3027472 RepID=UPI00247AE3B6|nr:VirK/YbjX family protein [Photobacterium sp. DA100]WEM45123.1 VirK/YbjX family protein [Photobacterium sp. DA100]
MRSSTHHFDYLRRLPQLANTVYPSSRGFRKIKKNARFCLWGVLNADAVKAMADVFAHPELAPVLQKNPKIFEKPLKPYLCVNWTRKEKIARIREHYLFIKDTFGSHAQSVLSPKGVTILEFTDNQEVRYKVQLCQGMSREGSLGLYLVDENNRNIYSLTCHIATGNKKTLYIGALQGPKEDIADRNQVIKTLTRSLHGLRTKALMAELVLILANVLGIDEVRGVSNKGHVYQALRYIGSKRKAVTFDYDDLWQEYGATKESAYFYRLPLQPPRKDPSSLKKTKRRLYTKRYQWLDEIKVEMGKNIRAVMNCTPRS